MPRNQMVYVIHVSTDVPVFLAKLKCPVLADRTYASLDLIVVNLLSSISRNTCTHTYVAPLGCIDIGEALLQFLEKCAK
jgi:hypothetical protein